MATRAVMTLRLKAGFASLVVLVLSLSVGANLVVFTVVNALFLRPPPIVDPDRVVLVTGGLAKSGSDEGHQFAEGGLQRVRSHSVFEIVAGQVQTSGENVLWRPAIALGGIVGDVSAIAVTPEYFTVMGLEKALKGRDFTREDDRPGAPVVAIISDRLWRKAFAGSADVIGAEVPASPVPIRVIGVAPPGFSGARLGENVDLWLPRHLSSQVSLLGQRALAISGARRSQPPLLALARLRPGVSIAAVDRALLTLDTPSAAPSLVSYQVIPVGKIYGTSSARTTVVERTTMLWIAAAASAIVLIAGCATLMAVVFLQYERRRHEFAIRTALGCSAGRLARSLVAELAGVGLAGVAGAALLAAGAFRMLPSLSLPGGIDLGRFDLSPDWRAVSFGAFVSIATLMIGAFAPIRRVTRPGIGAELVTSSSKATPSSLRLRRDVVALQVAVTAIALMAAGPFVRDIVSGFTIDPGFDVDRTLFVQAHTSSQYESEEERRGRQAAQPAKVAMLIDELRAMSGVTTIALGGSPIGPDQAASLERPRIFLVGPRVRQVPAYLADVDASYFATMGLSLLAGRNLTDADARVVSVERPVLVSDSFARAVWTGGRSVGHVFGVPRAPTLYRVVGIVGDVAVGSLRIDHRHAIFRPIDTTGSGRYWPVEIVIRSSDPRDLAESVRRTVARTFPAAFDADVATGREVVNRDSGRDRLVAWFFLGFGLVGLALGVCGVFGLVAFVAESRTREMGIRLALGAHPTQLVRGILVTGVAPVLAGTSAGIGVSAVLGQVVTTTFTDVRGLDPVVSVSVAAALIVAAGTASLAAAWRVRMVEPADVLRAE